MSSVHQSSSIMEGQGSVKAQLEARYGFSWVERFSTIINERPWEALAHIVVLVTCAIVLWRFDMGDKKDTKAKKDLEVPDKAETKPKSKFYADEDSITSLDFSQVTPYKESFDIDNEEPQPLFKSGYIQDRVYTATMAIQNLGFNDWILLDKNFGERLALKKVTVQQEGKEVINCLSPGWDGCVEFLELLVAYLPRRFPTIFTLSPSGNQITNNISGETFTIDPSTFDSTDATSPHHPLYIASRLTEDDISILTHDPTHDEYVLQAAIFGFPAGFPLSDKMGLPLTAIHGPVPTYVLKLKTAMNRFFKNVGPSRMVMRLNWGINDKLDLFLPVGGHLYEDDVEGAQADESIDVNQVQLRIERQTLRRMPRTRAIVFLTKTYVFPLTMVAKEPGFAKNLGGLLHKLPEKFAFYKRKPVWGKVVLAYLDEMAVKYPEVEEVAKS